MSGGTADFFYREARRLKYVARSAFKVIMNSLNLFCFLYSELQNAVWDCCSDFGHQFGVVN